MNIAKIDYHHCPENPRLSAFGTPGQNCNGRKNPCSSVSIRGFLMGAGVIGHQNKKNSEDGFTLIEALIALFVLTIGVLGMMTLQTNAIRGNYRANTMTIATSIASRQVEELRNLPFTSLTAGNATDPSTGYPIAWTLAQVPVQPGLPAISVNDARLIVVTVTRPNGMKPVTYSYIKFRDL